jgi:hypothetical protein
LRYAGDDLLGHWSQVDAAWQFGPDIRVERGAGGLVLERLVDGAALILRERLESVCDRDELVGGGVLLREFCRHRIGIRRRAWDRQGAVDEYVVLRRRLGGARTDVGRGGWVHDLRAPRRCRSNERERRACRT